MCAVNFCRSSNISLALGQNPHLTAVVLLIELFSERDVLEDDVGLSSSILSRAVCVSFSAFFGDFCDLSDSHLFSFSL